MKHLTITLLTLLMSMGAWSEELSFYSENDFFYKDLDLIGMNEVNEVRIARSSQRKLTDHYAPQILIDNVVALKCPNVRLKRNAKSKGYAQNEGDLYLQFLLNQQELNNILARECGGWYPSRDKEEALRDNKYGNGKGKKGLACEFKEEWQNEREKSLNQFLINNVDPTKYEELQQRGNLKEGQLYWSKYPDQMTFNKDDENMNLISWSEGYHLPISGFGLQYTLNRETLRLTIVPDKEKTDLKYYSYVYKRDQTKHYQCEIVEWTDVLKEREKALIKRQITLEELESNRKKALEKKESKRKF